MTNSSIVRLVVAVLALGLSACSPVVAKATIESSAVAALTAKQGQQAPPITCPGDMPAVVGTKQVCAITLDGKVYDVTVTITAFDGTTATYDVEVASTPRP